MLSGRMVNRRMKTRIHVRRMEERDAWQEGRGQENAR
jgi:hypothetical protein